LGVDEPLIDRGEIVALLFAVNDIRDTVAEIERLLREDGDEAEEDE
jgi:hypothetical protein